MKKIKDIFSYSVGHGAIGLSCSHKCKYYKYFNRKRECTKHNLNLNSIMLKKNTNFVKGEYFCKDYKDIGAHEIGLREFMQIKNKLEYNILYETCMKPYLCMTSFDKLKENNR